MLWPVTLVGILLGGALAAVPGAILGAVLGQALDRHWRLQRWSDLPKRLGQLGGQVQSFEQLLFQCMGRLAKSGGRVLPAHLQLARDLMQQYRLDEPARLQAMHWFNQGKTSDLQLNRAVKGYLRREPARAAEFMDCCWRMALADGVLSAQERQLLDEWSGFAGLGRAEQQRMHQRHQRGHQSAGQGAKAPVQARDSLKEAAALLGVEPNASPEQIKRAYRRQLSLHHPDKLIARGATAQAQDNAGEKIQAIQNAYERLRRHHGFR
ncbi:MAG: co-chaperone DjlA [Gammaproteobacteria bacterium HGW-Gammaproteobacteria-11]|nr:MAG: co-chaperone DjlA [Gammaproteobacteria bacterium HGW-Gammaproteobacteria-11]